MRLLAAALLLAASPVFAQTVRPGRVGIPTPTSDVSNARVKANGASQSRPLKEHLATLPDLVTLPDAALSVTATGTTASRVLKDRFADRLDAKDFQATCDGVANDATALQAAVTAIGSAARTLRLSGRCKTTGSVSFPSNVTLDFGGEGALDPAAATTITISGPLVAPSRRIFYGSGVIAFNARVPEADVRWWGAVGDGVTDDTAAIEGAIAAGVAGSKPVFFPPGTYRTIPATDSTDLAGALKVSWALRSGMHLFAHGGATIRIADNVSTDVAPQRMAMFHTNSAVSDLSFRGLIFDMNGANNPISPSRPVSYQTGMNQATISVSGTGARADDVVIEGCTFQNTAGTNQIVAGHTNSASTLGRNWKLLHNRFLNNGLDTSDHSCVYAWVDGALADGNVFENDDPYRTTGLTGMQTAYEIHGANQTFTNNRVKNAARGLYVASNYTSATSHSIVKGNTFETDYRGIDFFRDASGTAVTDAQITGNTFAFDDTLPTGMSGAKIAVAIEDQRAISDVLVQGNTGTKTGTNVGSAFVWADTSSYTDAGLDNIRVLDNHGTGFAQGVAFRAIRADAPWGHAEASRNSFPALTSAGALTGIGVHVKAAGTIQSLKLDGNAFVDNAGTAATPLGIYLEGGTITDLWLGPQFYKGITTNFALAGGISITRQVGPLIGSPVSADRGDTSQTLTVGTDAPVQRWATTLSANRTVTLDTTGAANGDRFRVVRTGLGAFTLDVGGLKTIPNSTAAFVDVTFDGSAWVLTGYGAL